MSYRLVCMVALAPLEGVGASARRLLAHLATYASDDGTGVYPSIRRLCTENGFARSTATDALRALEEHGVLGRVGPRRVGFQTVIEYRIEPQYLTKGWSGLPYQGWSGGPDQGGTVDLTRGWSGGPDQGWYGPPDPNQVRLTNQDPFSSIEQEKEKMGGVARASAHEAPTAAPGPFDEVLKAFYRLPSKQLIPQSLTSEEKGELIEMVQQHGADVVLKAIEVIGQKSHKWNRVKPEWLTQHLPEAQTEQQKSEDDALWARLQEELRKNPTYDGE